MTDQSGGASPQPEPFRCCGCGTENSALNLVCRECGARLRPATLAARAGGIEALTLEAARAQLLVAEGLLLRCEANLPRHLTALLADVRAFVGVDARGFRTTPTDKG